MKLQDARPGQKRHLLTDVTWKDIVRLENEVDIKNSVYQWHRAHLTNPPLNFNTASKLATIFAAIDQGVPLREVAKYLNIYPSTIGPYIDKYYTTCPTLRNGD